MRACLLALLALPSAATTAEKWADRGIKLPVDVALWLDASRQPAAYRAHGRNLANGMTLDVWYDGSGKRRHVNQLVQNLQPRYYEADGVGLVRFHGQEFLSRTGGSPALEQFTLFLVTVPRSNRGDFQAWLSLSALGKNDFQHGLTVDQSHGATEKFSQVNVEGKGFGAAVNLMRDAQPFGQLRLMRVEGGSGPQGIRLFIDGKPHGQRPRDKGFVQMETITIGARCYSNTDDRPTARGFLDGDIAEVLLFSRVLKPEEAGDVERQLDKKYGALARELAAGRHRAGFLLRPVADPPPVQVLVPGFTVRELPVQLPNINNVRYRHDGKLVALGYNGNVYLLSDKDGDGLEESVGTFWENKTGIRGPIGMALTPPSYPQGQGVFVASKGKVSLIVDTDGDDRADMELIVAQGWKEIPQAVDAIGAALDKNGNIYFGLGTANFANAYLITKDGKAGYDLKSGRGTIQKVSPDFKKRETVCTGVRFPVGLAFNRHGDLFTTDQEGATWLPNGNPFDELLHIQPGRHYGFPPRHPKILPNVIDEPSVFDYGPQHQSTCGLFFNEPASGGKTFGPASWAGDAFVCGESRGKIYRTRLVKLAVTHVTQMSPGYVAQTHLFACLQMLTVDACLSAKGDMVICCHSGPPDWGTGPQGKGKLFKISFTNHTAPQPLFAYAAGPYEARLVFDRALDADYLKKLPGKVKIEYGAYVRPGDRFETLAPPYAIVKQQLATPRYQLPVYSVQVTPDRRTLVLTTGRHVDAVHYAVTLPGFGISGKAGVIAQHDAIDVGYDLSGVTAEWTGKDGSRYMGWLPHFDVETSRALTAGSSEHEPLWQMIQKPGQFGVHTNLDLKNLLRPAVQPGSKLDYKLPPELVYVHMESPVPMIEAASSGTYSSGKLPNGTHWYRVIGSPTRWAVAGDKIGLHVSFATSEDDRQRMLPLHRHLVPWAEWQPSKTPVLANVDHPELRGGNWAKGKALFFSDRSQCGRCHQVRGEGSKIGPDLSNLIHRDYDSVLRDIRLPSAAMNPDHLTYLITLKDGRVLTGALRGEGDKLWVGTSEGKEIGLARNDVESLTATAVSIMPEGLDKKLTPVEVRDLLFFLLTEPATKKAEAR